MTMKSKTIVCTWGRMNPPTIGHEKLVAYIESVARRKQGLPVVFLSRSGKESKNPLPFKMKHKVVKEAFAKYRVQIASVPVRTIIEMAQWAAQGYDQLVFIVGQDRRRELETLLHKYNGKEYRFKSIEVLSAGNRDPDSDGIVGVSSSKLREAVWKGDWVTFRSGMPKTIKDRTAKMVFDEISKYKNTRR